MLQSSSVFLGIWSCLFGASQESVLRIDPMLLAEAEAVWKIIARADNAIWPGWNAADTPILIYLPGVQDVLINHPKPPPGFNPYSGPVGFSGGKIALKNGATIIEWDGQNTSKSINGTATLVLADTLSNRKQTVRGMLEDSRPAEAKLAEMKYEQLLTDPYDQMAMIAHEAFHVFQTKSAPNKGADERDVRLYPCLSVKNNVGFALEGMALAAALKAGDDATFRKAAVTWLAVRLDRRASLSAKAVEYEDLTEYNEGLAKYVEWRLFDCLEGSQPAEVLWRAQGFAGYESLAAPREQRVAALLQNMRGEANINNDPYGTSPLRFRLYLSGMAIAVLLDRLAPDWKSKIFADGVSLTGLARLALKASPEELGEALAAAKSGSEYAALVETKTRLDAEGRKDTEAKLAAILAGEKTLLTIDYSALGDPRIGMSFTPFGVRAVDEDRTIYSMIPLEVSIGSAAYGIKQSIPAPTLDDRKVKCFRFQLSEVLGADALGAKLRSGSGQPWTVDGLDLELPGARVKARRAQVEHNGREIAVKFLPKG